MSKNSLTPISFLKSQEARENYQCGICTEVCIKPMRCRGSCRRKYCMKCVSDAKQKRDICPLKCSSPFLADPISDIMLEFYCPYAPEDCHTTINSLQLFNTHYQTCPFVPPEELVQKQFQKDYKCPKGHQLEFFIGSYEEMLQSLCAICEQEMLCRSICRICDLLFCVNCRMPPCSKEGCPLGHSYNFQHIANLNFICDICGVSTSVSNDGVYDDNLCNMGICQGCYSGLPDKFDASKPRELIANVNYQCSCGEQLVKVDSIHKLWECSICKKTKQCPRGCSKCLRRYCLSCKLMDIENDNTCALDHQFQKINLSNFSVATQKQNEYGCMRCLAKSEEYYFDRHCMVRLCEGCFQYCRVVTGDKKRCVMLKCDFNHVLTYLSGSEDISFNCYQCNKVKIVKLRCFVCEADDPQNKNEYKTYCCQCKPIPLDTCYFQHQLKFAKFNQVRECHFCMGEFRQFHYCKKCYFYVCVTCKDKNQVLFQPNAIPEQAKNNLLGVNGGELVPVGKLLSQSVNSGLDQVLSQDL